jgi:NADH:ubiquinone oxidoreductase subunit 6 (subunit J)
MDNIQPILFYILAFTTGICALLVVFTQNIVRAATYLLFTLGGTAGIFFLLGADFVGATQILVYVGGTLVLVIFGVMLTAQGPFINMKTGAAEWAISALVGLALYGVLALSIMYPVGMGAPASPEGRHVTPTKEVAAHAPMRPLGDNPKNAPYGAVLGEGFLGGGVGPAHRAVGVERLHHPVVGSTVETVRTSYLLPFEIISVHLLVVLIGAAYLARAKRRRGANTP